MSKKKIMLGNEAIARGAYEAGVKVKHIVLLRLLYKFVIRSLTPCRRVRMRVKNVAS